MEQILFYPEISFFLKNSKCFFHNFLFFCSSLYSYLYLFLLSLGTMFLVHFLSTSQFPLLSILLVTISIVFLKMWQLHFLSETMLSWYWIFLFKYLPTISSEISLNMLITKTHIPISYFYSLSFELLNLFIWWLLFVYLFAQEQQCHSYVKEFFLCYVQPKVADADPFSILLSLCP